MNNKNVFVLEPLRIISQSFSESLAIGQCDACSPIITAKNEVPQPNSATVFYHGNPTLVKQTITPNNYTVLSPYARTFSVLNSSAMTCLQHFSTPKLLENIPSTWSENWGKSIVQSTLDQMIKLGLLVRETRQIEVCTPEEIPDMLAAWLHITDRCNLRCEYCYLLHHNTDMSLETGKASIEATIRSAVAHNYREVKLKYAGGEPLLRFSFVTELHRYAQALAEQYGLGLDGVVLSNGTMLTKEIVREMQALGVRLMISLDNVPTPDPSQEGKTHPCPSQEGNTHPYPSQEGNLHPPTPLKGGFQRRYPDGRDTAGDAMRAVELALECGLVPDISITVSGRNVHTLPELFEWVLERDLPFSLNFYRDPSIAPFDRLRANGGWVNTPFDRLRANGGWVNTPFDTLRANGYDDLKLKEEKFVAGMLEAYKVIETNLPQRSLLASLVDLANFAAPHLRRCSVGHSYLVFDCEGRVSKCQMQMDQPVTDIQTEDPLAMIQADESGIQNITVDEKEGCQTCQWRYWCAGGCPLETFRATGRYDVKSPNCNIYKALYPEVLRLEGLRLLKYAEEIKHGPFDSTQDR